MSLFDESQSGPGSPASRPQHDRQYGTGSLHDVLGEVLENYLIVKQEPAAKHPFMNWFRRLGSTLPTLVPTLRGLVIEPSAGHSSNWSRNPYINIRKTELAPERNFGISLAYFFRDDMSAVYLGLYFACEEAADGPGTVRERVDKLRNIINVPPKFQNHDMFLGNSNTVRKFQNGYIFGIAYPAAQLPDDATLKSDLEALVQAYEALDAATVQRIIGRSDVQRLRDLGGGDIKRDAAYKLDDLLADTLWTEEQLEDILAALDPKGEPSRQVILAGPPGTGKTWVAKCLVKYLTQSDSARSKFVQFHPSYTYEQFIEGLRPVSRDGMVEFKPEAGVVLRFAEDAKKSDERFYLIIDEINRANLPRVLGELMYLFEYRDDHVDLAYTHNFALPPNLAFIGTMNTADRSIRSIDIALRRRFDIFECLADPDILERYYEKEGNVCTVPDLVEGFTKLNDTLEKALDRYHTIGQTFFMAKHFSEETLRNVWRRRIGPTLAEYFFDQPEELEKMFPERFWAIE